MGQPWFNVSKQKDTPFLLTENWIYTQYGISRH